ncbi:MAG: tubulin-like doman-containing protein [Phycisphaerae bacterium]
MKKTEHLILSDKHQRGLVIGIGGSGAEVLASNRRRMIGKYGSMENVPMVRYLYLDTDPKWWKEHQSRVEKNIRLSQPEFVDIQFPAAAELYRGIKRGNYPHYAWFDLQKLENLKSVTDGAGTVRQMARLAFWQHYTTIREKIEAQINALRNDSVATYMRTHHGIQLDEGITVYIVAGLAGGTSSGLWLDTAYLVQKVLKDMGIAGVNHIVGYGILPQAFKDLPGTNSLANGYAVLKELNYFSYRYAPTNQLASVYGEPTWDADYLRDNINRVSFKRQAPFEFCYLLDARNAFVDLHRKDIYHMIDCAIFHEFVGSFATYKRSLRCNLKNQLIQNDRTDCPSTFMSFGQSAALVPTLEIKQVLAHQLALQAVQEWIDKKANPIKALVVGGNGAEEDLAQSVVGSIRTKAREPVLVGNVRGWLVRDFMKSQGLNRAGVFAAVVQEQQERLTDIPYALLEGVKQEWITENWPYNGFVGRAKNAWEKWRIDFTDEGSDRMRWGERIRKLEANKAAALKTYKKLFREEAFRMFEDSEHFGPAWAVCALQQLKSALGQLKQQLVDEAGNANVIANALGDVYVIDAVAGNKGPSLSAIIEAKAGKDLDALNAQVQTWWLTRSRKVVCDAAYQYLLTCALWCRAKVEERARRVAAELLDLVIQYLDSLEAELIGHAAILANLEGELVKQTRAWNQKAAQSENVGAILYDSGLLETLEGKLRQIRGDQYSASIVAQKGLAAVGGNLRDLQQGQVTVLLARLVEAGLEAVGDLNEAGLEDTEFAAHDLLSASHRTDDTLDGAMREVIRKSDPYIRLTPALEDGGWNRSDLVPVDGAGLRGGGQKENDPDKDHARIIESLARCGWNIRDGVCSVDDGSQIVLFKECGGFPLRALQGVAEMKEAYEQHRQQPNTPPLHIVRDEMAECFPDLYPPQPETLEKARLVQTVGIPLGFIAQRDFPSTNGNGTPNRQYAFLRHIEELGEEQPIPLGMTVETIGMRLANNPELLAEIEHTISAAMTNTSGADKVKSAGQLRQHLNQKKITLKAESPSIDVENAPAYQAERDRIVAFMRKYGLVNGSTEATTGNAQLVKAGSA